MSPLPSSPAAERNRGPLLDVLTACLGEQALNVLEIGSGTGQHAAYFAAARPNLTWQTSDLPDNHTHIEAWRRARPVKNLLPPLAIDVDRCRDLPVADTVFTANTFHIMAWVSVCRLIDLTGRMLGPAGRLIVYGPFNVGGLFTSQSNKQFDRSLRAMNPAQGIRSREAVCWHADAAGMSLVDRFEMPANNQTLVFERRA